MKGVAPAPMTKLSKMTPAETAQWIPLVGQLVELGCVVHAVEEVVLEEGIDFHPLGSVRLRRALTSTGQWVYAGAEEI